MLNLTLKEFGFITEKHCYEVDVQEPLASIIKLRDTEDEVVYQSEVVEPKFKTPGFFSYGMEGMSQLDLCLSTTVHPRIITCYQATTLM